MFNKTHTGEKDTEKDGNCHFSFSFFFSFPVYLYLYLRSFFSFQILLWTGGY